MSQELDFADIGEENVATQTEKTLEKWLLASGKNFKLCSQNRLVRTTGRENLVTLYVNRLSRCLSSP
jgi:hypothetical protein